jgi:D-amino-acid oxidase
MPRETDVLVVGAGVIGLTAAVRLQERGARVTVWTAHESDEIVSSVAAAVWYPTRTEAGPRVLRWAAATYDEFRRQIAGGVPGLLLRRTRNLLRRPITVPPWWAPAAGGVEVRDSAEPYRQEVCFPAPLAEMETYLAWLRDRVAGAGGRIERRRVSGLDEATAEARIVVNATGLAAGALCDDPAVVPARGHVVLVGNPGLDESLRDEDGGTYIHPRSRDVVLGGTFEVGRGDTEPDAAEADAIVRRCVALVPRLAGARRTGERIGLRPVRDGGPRVELDDAGRIVHAYGHGGAGMTLAWGCADEVADLAEGAH